MDEHAAPDRHSTLMMVLVVTSIIATGIVVAGLTATPEEPELTVQPVTSTVTPPPTPEEYVLVTPEVDYPQVIPGCTAVDEPEETLYSSLFVSSVQSYDNPAAPWFSGPKAHLMSEALVRVLPGDTEFDDGVIPYFDPIPEREGAAEEEVVDSTNATASISRNNRSGYLSVGVSQSTGSVPPCVAGNLDERRTMPDGTVVDTHDTWQEVNGERTSERSAFAYRTDGSWIAVYLSAPGQQEDLPIPLDILADIATDPAFITSSAPPAGTPGNSADCGSSAFSDTTGSFTAPDISALNAALRQANTESLAPSPSLGSLRTHHGGGALCQVVNSAAGQLTITIGDTAQPDPGRYTSGTSVSVPTPSGLTVTIATETPWDTAVLEQLASTPRLDLS
ncbi:hypothetical protein O1W68_18965 [Rhodococcus sp. H36-A4]|uniref:hypothetical protein n=1 Tax=Rhodococcus sp. H36-A4 TaxID=3004353 RepID=UPI0022AE80FA|nr:hypothetical protein [Rhodococcus sp. H36-A4]MCZ4080033.1 hypothetical protein [Rhodococcus sp. H36-A4]